MSERRGSYLEGLIVGGVLGAVAALFIAAQKGEETRRQIQQKWSEVRHQGIDALDGVREEAGEMLHQGIELLEMGLARISVAIDEGRKAADDKREELEHNGHRL